jgi:hypothetical protein
MLLEQTVRRRLRRGCDGYADRFRPALVELTLRVIDVFKRSAGKERSPQESDCSLDLAFGFRPIGSCANRLESIASCEVCEVCEVFIPNRP